MMASPTSLHGGFLTAQDHAGSTLAGYRIRLQRAGELLLQTLREIFDENAYQRFLKRRGLAHSRAAYAEFLEELRQRKERRVRCC
jgi:hypothetical protein